jgi:hypothetical protein
MYDMRLEHHTFIFYLKIYLKNSCKYMYEWDKRI